MSANEPIRVMHVLGALDTGGAELRVLDLIRYFGRDSGIQFEFVTLSGRRGELAEEFERAGATVVPMRLGSTFPLTFVRRARATRPLVVQSHVALTSGLILALSWTAGVRVRIAHFHSDGDGRNDSYARNVYRAVMRWLIHRCATHIVGVSPSALSRGYGRSTSDDPRARIIANGVDAAGLAPSASVARNDTRILSLGRAAPEKNLPRMPGVLAALLIHDPTAELDVVGPRNPEIDDVVLQKAAEHGVADRVHLHDARSDVGTVLAGADALLLTSTREGLPSVVIEAAAVGVPVVSSDVGGSVWIAESFPWVHCISLDEADSAWAETLARAVRTRPDGTRARRAFACSPFTLESNVCELRRIYTGQQ